MEYPKIPKDDFVRNYHGTEIPDGFENFLKQDSSDRNKWVNKQNELTQSIVGKSPELQKKILKTLKNGQNFVRYSSPRKINDRYYFYKNTGLQDQSVYYYQTSLEENSQEIEFLNINKWKKKGEATPSIGCSGWSENGEYFAFGVSESGSDWEKVHILKKDGTMLEETINYVKFSSISWKGDEGFFYSKYPPKNEKDKQGTVDKLKFHSLYYHKIGTLSEKDVYVYGSKTKEDDMFFSDVSDDQKYLIISVCFGCDPANKIYISDLENLVIDEKTGMYHVEKVIDNLDFEYEYITNYGTKFIFKTNNNAEMGKVIEIDISKSEEQNWVEVVPQKKDVLTNVSIVNEHYLILCYLHNVVNQLFLYNIQDQTSKELALPDLGSVYWRSSKKNNEFFLYFTSFLHPSTILRYDFETTELKEFKKSTVENFEPELFQTKQIFYHSKDGTKIPMFIISLNNEKEIENAPCMLYGYGGFNISIQPTFSIDKLIWVKYIGGIYCVANIRGGGEYGEAWHKLAKFEKKQNVFDDFIAASEYLIRENYTSTKKLTISGASNGGLLTMACCNQRPDLFGCVISKVGVLNMLEYHNYSIGIHWTSEYGCSKNKKDFDYLIKYSPVHNVDKNKVYPNVLITTGLYDDRVTPYPNAFKMISVLQDLLPNNPNPLNIRITMNGGHGGRTPLSLRLEESADIFTYIIQTLNLETFF
ncbi:prolyl endopeptidase [Anaeramoeba flamelloides]|uniref:Prolyl endopeptidase n=1 Tax=Anaeramoeba flamelloides TaxID=1746091 RepID=A0ABQ8YAE4_9EUKA|nr:prolyl endopeptidase [Anaeramoeba flamelloides]